MAITVQWHDGWDFYTTVLVPPADLYSDVQGTLSTTVQSGGRNSGNLLRTGRTGAVTAGWVRVITANYTEFVGGDYFTAYGISGNWSTGGPCSILSAYEGTTSHLNIAMANSATSAHDLLIRRGTTVLETLTGILIQGSSYYIELAGKIDDSTGYYKVWINGVVVADSGGVDTRNAGTGTCNKWQIGQDVSGGAVGSEAYGSHDDCYFATVTSGPDHLGDVRCFLSLPNGAGSSAQFTPSAGSNYQNVDESPSYDDDTTYNADKVSGEKDLFTHVALPTPGTIYSSRTVIRARKDDSGSISIRELLRSGSTDYNGGTDRGLGDAYGNWMGTFRTVDPDTSADWDQTGWEATQIGYKVV